MFIRKGASDSKSVLIQTMHWRLTGTEPLHDQILSQIYNITMALLGYSVWSLGEIELSSPCVLFSINYISFASDLFILL